MSEPLSRMKRYCDRAAEYLRLANLAEAGEKADQYRLLAGHYMTLADLNLSVQKQLEQAEAVQSKPRLDSMRRSA